MEHLKTFGKSARVTETTDEAVKALLLGMIGEIEPDMHPDWGTLKVFYKEPVEGILPHPIIGIKFQSRDLYYESGEDGAI